ncbi:hypothetical protein C9374_000042 [Naegleria lovaniensis]|uniref:Guanine deaminase n=1 Tax=Naegleria lovaniensis TaxID=51637 RepID=A0AA88GZQ4_NAELO|nr:uncharacterized protein C9374_000042 [Naegleria lovaniensis]KAG2388603.1 hypothetical protein C9374_000042 [Naegleria lovaniensis]
MSSTSSSSRGRVIIGAFVHALTSTKSLNYCPKGAIIVSKDGMIEKVIPSLQSLQTSSSSHSSSLTNLLTSYEHYEHLTLKPSQLLIPGFIDTHAHAPQYFNSGLGLDMPLLEWLHTYTFPVESRFNDAEIANRVYRACVRRSLQSGTTTSVYFATIHNEASLKLAEITEELGQRAYIGKVNMDRFAPEYYCEETSKGIKDARKFVVDMMSKNFKLAKPILTPRFAVSCTEELMKGLADIAEEFDLPIQSHISENVNEVKLVKELFKNQSSYAGVYDEVKLLNHRTILAHGVYLTDEEINLLKEKKATIAHCPLSNFSINSGVLNVRKLLNRGVKVSLGTDYSGGYSVSMLNAIRNTLIASVSVTTDHIRNGKESTDDDKCLSLDEAFYLATIGGATALNIENKVGNFEEGKLFDALVVDVEVADSMVDSFSDIYPKIFPAEPSLAQSQDTLTEKRLKENFSRFIYNGDDRNIVKIFVQGNEVSGNLRV